MKKIMTLLLMVLMAVGSVWGQLRPNEKIINGWFIVENEADELVGTKANSQYFFINGTLSISIFPEQNLTILGGEQVIFDVDTNEHVYGIIGLYDENNRLIEKYETYLDCSGGKYGKGKAYTAATGFAFSHIKNHKGYVRFVFPTWGNSVAFDFTVPCLQNDPAK